MLEKKRGWKIGVITKGIKPVAGEAIEKGSEVYYKRARSIRDREGFLLSRYEWHYMTDKTYVRTTELIIEGQPYKDEADRNKKDAPAPELCSSCCKNEKRDDHTCPYKVEINENEDYKCNCCEECEYNCSQDI